MNEDRQIEEIEKVIQPIIDNCWRNDWFPNSDEIAKAIYDNDYRKASEVIEEIEKYILEGASTIQTDNSDAMYGAKFAIEKVVIPILEAYKKKYKEEEK